MIFPVTTSESVLEFDALPALKCTFWQAGSQRVYTMARLYASFGWLQLSLCAFERNPVPSSAVGFVLSGGSSFLYVGVTPQAAFGQMMSGLPATLPEQPGPDSFPLNVERFSGNDEQGWYWGAKLALSPDVLKTAGCTLALNQNFHGALFKYGSGPKGSSCPIDTSHLNQFSVVDY